MSAIIDIIIPCYYSSDIIRPCFYSLSQQSVREQIRIIMVNDCSPYTDCDYKDLRTEFSNTLQILYLKTPQNSGPGVARQVGLNEAIKNQSQYIMFIDDDDSFFANNSIEYFINIIEHHCKMYSNEILAFIGGNRNIAPEHWSFTGSIFNVKLIDRFNLTFDHTYYDEDSLFFMKYLFECRYYEFSTKKSLGIYTVQEFYNDESIIITNYNLNNNFSLTKSLSFSEMNIASLQAKNLLCKYFYEKNIDFNFMKQYLESFNIYDLFIGIAEYTSIALQDNIPATIILDNNFYFLALIKKYDIIIDNIKVLTIRDNCLYDKQYQKKIFTFDEYLYMILQALMEENKLHE